MLRNMVYPIAGFNGIFEIAQGLTLPYVGIEIVPCSKLWKGNKNYASFGVYYLEV